MLIEHQNPFNKSITVALLGAPNVGKSSLANCLLGQDLSIVTHKPQTTRNRFCCVTTIGHTEIVMVDTPGLHKSSEEFNKRLNQQAREGIDGTDLNLLLIDLTKPVFAQFVNFEQNLKAQIGRLWVLFTKADRITDVQDLPLDEVIEKAKDILPSIEKHFVISSKEKTNIGDLTGALCEEAPEGPHHFSDGSLSNKNERFFVIEYIREQAFLLLKDELPYEVAVTIDEYTDMRERGGEKAGKIDCYISATIHVNRPSQRGIVVGTKGTMIKEIGTRARQRIEELIDGRVHLNLHVKVSPKWFKNNFILEELGLPRAVDSRRVWRKK